MLLADIDAVFWAGAGLGLLVGLFCSGFVWLGLAALPRRFGRGR